MYMHGYSILINFLLRSSSVVSAAIFRIFGQELAELPLVATSSDCQGKVSLSSFVDLLYFLSNSNLAFLAIFIQVLFGSG